LSYVDAVGAAGEGKVGPVVEDEGHVVTGAHSFRYQRSRYQLPGFEALIAQLNDVNASGNARLQELR